MSETNPTATVHPHPVERRMDFPRVAPELYRAMTGLDRAVRESGLDPTLLELIKVRASQINGCAFCIDMHTLDARAQGESEQRLYALSAWRESPFFTERERAALALTEAITLLTEGHVPDEVYERAEQVFGEEELARVVWAAATINTWNRVAVTCRSVPGHYRPGDHR